MKELEKGAATALYVNNTSDTARRAAAERAISSSVGPGGATGAKAKQKKAHGALLEARRGDVKSFTVKGNYNKGSYDFDGEMGAPVSICGLGQQIKDGTVLERDLYMKQRLTTTAIRHRSMASRAAQCFTGSKTMTFGGRSSSLIVV